MNILKGILFSTLLISSRMSFACAGSVDITGPAIICPNVTSYYSSELASGFLCFDWEEVNWTIEGGDAQFVDQNGGLLGTSIACCMGGGAYGCPCEPTAGSFVRIKAFTSGSFTVHTRGNCTGLGSSTSSRQISVGLHPPTSINGPTEVGCVGTTVQLTAGNVQDATSYTWQVPNDTWKVNGQPGPNVIVTYVGPLNPPPNNFLSTGTITMGSTIGNAQIGVRANNSLVCLGNGFVYKNLTLTTGTPTISGPDVICSSGSYSSSGAPGTVSWSSSNPAGLSINSITGAANRINNFNGSITITNSLTNVCGSINITKAVWVGPPLGVVNFDNPIPDYFSTSDIYSFGIEPLGFFGGHWDVSGGYIVSTTDGPYTQINFTAVNSFATVTVTPDAGGCGSGDLSTTVFVGQNGCPPGDICPNFISPNPSDDELKVSLNQTSEEKRSIEVLIYNSQSELVQSDTFFGKEFKIAVKNLPDGVYYIHLKRGDKTLQRRIVVKHKQ